jgi:hypothetical protein
MSTDDEIPALTPERQIAVMERLFARIENREKLHEIHLDLVALRGEQRAANAKLEEMGKTLYGNGTPGLKTHVDRLNQDLSDRKWRERVLWAAVVTALVGELFLLVRPLITGAHP